MCNDPAPEDDAKHAAALALARLLAPRESAAHLHALAEHLVWVGTQTISLAHETGYGEMILRMEAGELTTRKAIQSWPPLRVA